MDINSQPDLWRESDAPYVHVQLADFVSLALGRPQVRLSVKLFGKPDVRQGEAKSDAA